MSLLPFLQLPEGPKESWWPLAERFAERVKEVIEEILPETTTERDLGDLLTSLSKQTGIQLLNLMMIINGRYNITLKEISALEIALDRQLVYISGVDDLMEADDDLIEELGDKRDDDTSPNKHE